MDDSGEKPNFIGFYKHRLRGFFLKMRSLIEDNRIWEKGCPYPPKLIQPYPKKGKLWALKACREYGLQYVYKFTDEEKKEENKSDQDEKEWNKDEKYEEKKKMKLIDNNSSESDIKEEIDHSVKLYIHFKDGKYGSFTGTKRLSMGMYFREVQKRIKEIAKEKGWEKEWKTDFNNYKEEYKGKYEEEMKKKKSRIST